MTGARPTCSLNKLSRLFDLAPLAVLPACSSSTAPFDSVDADDPENLGQTTQASLLRWTGYPVQFTGLASTKGYELEIHVGDSVTESFCDNTSMTLWVWHRYNGSSQWTYAGTATDNAWWSEYVQNCLHLFKHRVNGPQGSYEVLVKAQSRSESTGSGIGYAFHRPVTLKAHRQY